MFCFKTTLPEGLASKNIASIIQCFPREELGGTDIEEVRERAASISRIIQESCNLFFSDNEAINDNYLLYRFRIKCSGKDGYIGLRIVVKNHRIVQYIFTFGKGYSDMVPTVIPFAEEQNMWKTEAEKTSYGRFVIPKGQRYIPYFIIYRILGQPQIRLESWRLSIKGLVSSEKKYSYNDLIVKEKIKIKRDFHCVTGWSVKNVIWEGIPLKVLASEARVRENARWAYIKTAEGYSTIVPLEDFMHEASILALKINGKPLPYEQGFPARIVIPHLYGWKSAKWVTEIVFLDKYRDGYWESLGYHWRGNVYLDERFKEV